MSPELAHQAAFAQPTQQRTTPVLKSLADKARERRHAVLALQGGLTVVQEEGAPNGPGESHELPPSPSSRLPTLPSLAGRDVASCFAPTSLAPRTEVSSQHWTDKHDPAFLRISCSDESPPGASSPTNGPPCPPAALVKHASLRQPADRRTPICVTPSVSSRLTECVQLDTSRESLALSNRVIAPHTSPSPSHAPLVRQTNQHLLTQRSLPCCPQSVAWDRISPLCVLAPDAVVALAGSVDRDCVPRRPGRRERTAVAHRL